MKIFKMTVILMGVSFGAMAGEAEGLSQILKKIDETNPLKDLRSISLIGSQSQQTTVKLNFRTSQHLKK